MILPGRANERRLHEALRSALSPPYPDVRYNPDTDETEIVWHDAAPPISNVDRAAILSIIDSHDPSPDPLVRIVYRETDPLLEDVERTEVRRLKKDPTDAELEGLRQRLGAIRVERAT